MADTDPDFGEIKREMVEARNQAIKTDNLVKNLALDVKGFEQRFDRLERRTRWTSIGVHLVVAGIIIGAAAAVHVIIVGGVRRELVKAQKAQTDTRTTADGELAALNGQLTTLKTERATVVESEELAMRILDHVDANHESQALELVDKLSLDQLGPLAQRLARPKLVDLVSKAADEALKLAKSALGAGRHDIGVRQLMRHLEIDPDGKHAAIARYLLATNLWTLRRYKEAEPVLRELNKSTQDKALLEEVRFLLGTTLARMGIKDEAMTILREAVETKTKFAERAQAYLDALEHATQLPEG